MKEPLTKKQYETLQYLKKYSKKYGYMPTCMELSEKFGIAIGGSTDFRIKQLEKKGYITRFKAKPRGLIINE